MRLRATPARLLFDEGMRRRRRRGWRRSRRRRGTGQRTVSRGSRGRKVQHGCPLRSATHRQGAAAAATQRGYRRQQRVQVPHVGAHLLQLSPGRPAVPLVWQTLAARLSRASLGPDATRALDPQLLGLPKTPRPGAGCVRRCRLRSTRGRRLLRQEEVQDRGEEATGPRLQSRLWVGE